MFRSKIGCRNPCTGQIFIISMEGDNFPRTNSDSCSLDVISESNDDSFADRSDPSEIAEDTKNNNSEYNEHTPKIPVTYVKHSPSHFECTINNCGKAIKTLRSLLKHAETHQDKSTYKYACEEPGCGKRFLKKYSLELHYRVHMNLRPFICAICGKSFRGSGDLERHFRIHTGSKPYKCLFQNCDKSYSQPENLRIHVRTHTGDRPFTCTHPDCDKDFYSKSNLIAHLRIHQGIRPYECETCGMAFTENSSLYKHRKIHLKAQNLTLESIESQMHTLKPSWNSATPNSFKVNNCTQDDEVRFLEESPKKSLMGPLSLSPLPKTTILFLAPEANEMHNNMRSFQSAALLTSVEPRMHDHSYIPEDELDDETACSDEPVSDQIVEFDDGNKEFTSDVDRSADLGLDRINHQPDASIKVGLDEFMNSIRPDSITTEYVNGEISFI